MIRGRLFGIPGRRRPFVSAHVAIPAHGVRGSDVMFLIDTGADSTTLAPGDARGIGLPLDQLASGMVSAGVGGRTRTALVPATVTLGPHDFELRLRVLLPGGPEQRAALTGIPSLLGRDVLARFALFFEERTSRVLLLEPAEADALPLPAG